jgi:ribose transport system substrate-binding protein
MNKIKKMMVSAMSVLAIVALVACSGTSPEPTDSGSEAPPAAGGEIAVLVPSADHGWTGAVLTYAQEEAAAIGGDYTAKVYAATDAKAMSQQIDDLLAAATPPAGIVILPYDNTLEAAMQKVAESGVPFVMFDRIIDNASIQEKVVANVKGDNEGIGKETAKRFIADGLQPGDKIYVIIGDTSSVPQMRNDGFVAELKANGWTDEQIATIEYSAPTGWSRAEGKKIFIDWINAKTAEELADYHWLFTHDSEIAMGILEALSGSDIEAAKKDAFLEATTAFGSSSGLDEIYQVLKGEHSNGAYADIVKNFDLFDVTYDPAMIKNAIQDLLKSLQGESVPKDDTISVSVVDSTNVSEFQGF